MDVPSIVNVGLCLTDISLPGAVANDGFASQGIQCILRAVSKMLASLLLSILGPSALGLDCATAQGPQPLRSLATLSGACQQLTLAGRDASKACIGKLVNTAYRNGRSGFTFAAGDLAVITFSGIDSAAQGNHAAIRLDKVIFTLLGTGTKPNSISATGQCLYSNPYVGPAYIRCSAATNSGPFTASFRSNGEPPELQQFGNKRR